MIALNKIVSNFETPANLSLLLTLAWVIEEKLVIISRSAVLIGQYANTKANELDHKDLIEEVLKRVSGSASIKYLLEADNGYEDYVDFYKFTENFNDEELLYHTFGRKSKAIWFIDSLESFSRLEKDLLNERYYYQRNGFFCIVYTGTQKDLMSTMRYIFQRLFKIYVINVNVLLRTGRVTRVYTYLPFTRTKCHNSEPHLHGIIGAATGYTLKKREFFIRKLTNMWGCPLDITTWQEPPFIVLEKGEIKGIEGFLIKELAERKNFAIRLNEAPEKDRKYAFPNQTDTGFMKRIVNAETNITIVGLMYNKDRLQISEAAYTYMNVPLVLAIPRGRTMSPWERIVRPFKYLIWSCFSSSIIMGVITIFGLKRFFKPYVHRFVFGRGIRTPFTNLWNVLYGGPVYGPLPKRNFARYILAVWIFYSWILRSAYIGELFILLQDSRARSYLKTVSEVMKKNFTFFSYPLHAHALHGISVPESNIGFINTEEHSLPKLIEMLRDEFSNIAIAILGPVVQAYNRQKENVAHQINVLPEPLFMASITYYMPKHSYLTFEFDDMLLKLRSAGFIRKFSDFYVSDETPDVETEEAEPTALSLWLLLGLFSVYLVLLFLCSLVFFFELRSRRSKLIKRIIDFFNY